MERRWELTRRDVLRFSVLGAAGSTLGLLHRAARLPIRLSDAAVPALPDIQHDIAPFLAPVETIDGVAFRFGPVFTKFVTADLMRTPTSDDQQVLAAALDTIEDTYGFAPGGALTFVAYGLPYFPLLPRGLAAAYVPRVLADPRRLALEEAIPAPTDVTYRFGGARKQRFNVPVRIEAHALLFTIRSDSLPVVNDVDAWLAGSNVLARQRVPSPALQTLLRFDPARVMFSQRGMPRRIAEEAGLPFAARDQPGVTDVDGLRRPADVRRWARRDHHVRRATPRPRSTNAAVGRLLRQRVDHPPLSRHRGPRAVLPGPVDRVRGA